MNKFRSPIVACGALLVAAIVYLGVAFQSVAYRADADEPPAIESVAVLGQTGATIANAPAAIQSESGPKDDSPGWNQPDVVPEWMTRGAAATERLARSSAVLEHVLTAKYDPQPLDSIIDDIARRTESTFTFRQRELEAFGVDVETPRSLDLVGEYTVREALQALLTPLECTWAVTESGLAITSPNDPNAALIRHYDLAHVLPDSGHVDTVMNALMQTCQPDSWLSNGGGNVMLPVGSVLMVSAPEPLHHEIEIQLYRLSQVDRANLLATPTTQPTMPGFGMGGGFGSGGGMGIGIGGGMGMGMGGGTGMGGGQPQQSNTGGGY